MATCVGNTPCHIKNSTDFTNEVQKLTLDLHETIVSFDVVSLFICIHATEAVRKQLQHQICTWLDLCLITTYFKYNKHFYRQKLVPWAPQCHVL